MKRAAVYTLLSILAASISGCQTRAVPPIEGNHTCVEGPYDLVECSLNEDTETVGEA